MKSVCSYYRNRGTVILRDIIKLDDWNGTLKTVQDAENAVQKDSDVYNTLRIRSHLEQLVRNARSEETKLHEIYLVLQHQDSMQAERENNQCLKDLCLTNDMTRIEETKGGLLADSYVWILNHRDFIDWRDGGETRLFWIKGDPGKGKTMLLIGVVKELQKLKSTHDSGLLSYFFCQGTDSRLNNATAVLRALIYQLLVQQRSLISHLREQYDTAGRQLFEGDDAFYALRDIFIKILHDPCLTRVYLVVDALDECESGLSQVLDLIVRNTSISSSRVKWLVSSRNRHDIEIRLRVVDSRVELSLESNAERVSGVVHAYINHKISELARKKGYDPEFQSQVSKELHQKANKTFLWVALVCKELAEAEDWDVLPLLQEVPSDLTSLYDRMIKQIGKLKHQSLIYCMQVLSTSTLAYRPLHLLELAALADLPKEVSCKKENLRKIIHMCGSFLTIREDIIYFIHQSAKDYLSTSVDDFIFPDGRTEIHRGIVSRSLQYMTEKLHRDMYNLRDPGILIDQVISVDPDPLVQIRYACVYWIYHLCEVDRKLHDQVGLCDNGIIDIFLKKHFLHWLEALSLMGKLSSGVVMIRELENFLAVSINMSRLLDLVRDARRFILYNRWIIENAPLQAYASALVFSPARSLTREEWKKEEPKWITTKPIMESKWSSCLQTLEGHSDWVYSVAFSHDSRQVASASSDRTVKIWDAATGVCLQTLEGHSDWVWSVAFSHDSRQVASASDDRTVKIWDAATGVCLQTLEGHSGWVYVGGLLARLTAGRVGLGRSHGQDLGRSDGRVSADARGP